MWPETNGAVKSNSQTLAKFAAASIRTLDRDEKRFRLPLGESIKQKARALLDALKALPSGSFKKSTPTDHTPTDHTLTDHTLTDHTLTDHTLTGRTLEESIAMERLQEFFFAAVTDSVEESQDNRFKCPVLAYIACFGYNNDNTFKLAPEVTSLLAGWKFLLRCTVLYHAKASTTASELSIPQ